MVQELYSRPREKQGQIETLNRSQRRGNLHENGCISDHQNRFYHVENIIEKCLTVTKMARLNHRVKEN